MFVGNERMKLEMFETESKLTLLFNRCWGGGRWPAMLDSLQWTMSLGERKVHLPFPGIIHLRTNTQIYLMRFSWFSGKRKDLSAAGMKDEAESRWRMGITWPTFELFRKQYANMATIEQTEMAKRFSSTTSKSLMEWETRLPIGAEMKCLDGRIGTHFEGLVLLLSSLPVLCSPKVEGKEKTDLFCHHKQYFASEFELVESIQKLGSRIRCCHGKVLKSLRTVNSSLSLLCAQEKNKYSLPINLSRHFCSRHFCRNAAFCLAVIVWAILWSIFDFACCFCLRLSLNRVSSFPSLSKARIQDPLRTSVLYFPPQDPFHPLYLSFFHSIFLPFISLFHPMFRGGSISSILSFSHSFFLPFFLPFFQLFPSCVQRWIHFIHSFFLSFLLPFFHSFFLSFIPSFFQFSFLSSVLSTFLFPYTEVERVITGTVHTGGTGSFSAPPSYPGGNYPRDAKSYIFVMENVAVNGSVEIYLDHFDIHPGSWITVRTGYSHPQRKAERRWCIAELTPYITVPKSIQEPCWYLFPFCTIYGRFGQVHRPGNSAAHALLSISTWLPVPFANSDSRAQARIWIAGSLGPDAQKIEAWPCWINFLIFTPKFQPPRGKCVCWKLNHLVSWTNTAAKEKKHVSHLHQNQLYISVGHNCSYIWSSDTSMVGCVPTLLCNSDFRKNERISNTHLRVIARFTAGFHTLVCVDSCSKT